ncbi:MAG: hypothetical protein ACYCTY_16695 [Sulfuricella sp.]
MSDKKKPKNSSTIPAMAEAAVTAHIGSVKIEGVSIKVGDSVEDVQKSLETKLDPQAIGSPNPIANKRTELRLKTKGIWIFFEKGKVVTFRVDAPFPGAVGGLRIGDPASKIEKTFGPAVKHGMFGVFKTYMYYFDDVTTTRFDVNTDDEIETIYFFK